MPRLGPCVLLSTHWAMPTFVVGFELPAGASISLGERLSPELCPFVLFHEHQWGSHVCMQTMLLGITLCFERNLDRPRGRLPLDALRQGLLSLGELGQETRPSGPLHPEVTWLSGLLSTYGQNFEEDDRTRLEKTVGEAVPGLPPIEWAAEAFVRFAPGVPEGLRGWRALAYDTPGPLTLDDGNFPDVRPREGVELTDARLHALEALGRREGLGPVRTFLLWENSD